MAVRETHQKLGCDLGIQSYVNSCQLIGVSAPGINKTVARFHDSCPSCLQMTSFFKGKSPFSKALLKTRGPDDLLATTVQQDPLTHLIIDQTGPLFYPNPDCNSKDEHLSTYILLAVKLATHRTLLVLIKSMGVMDVIKGIE